MFDSFNSNSVCSWGFFIFDVLRVLIVWYSGRSWWNSWTRSWWAHSTIDKTPARRKSFSKNLLSASFLRLFCLCLEGIECASLCVHLLIIKEIVIKCLRLVWSKGSIRHQYFLLQVLKSINFGNLPIWIDVGSLYLWLLNVLIIFWY